MALIETVDLWKKRNPKYMRENLDPTVLNREEVLRYYEEYGSERVRSHLSEMREYFARPRPEYWRGSSPMTPRADLDDWGPAKIQKKEDIRDLFIPNFYFGCEGDSSINPLAFNSKVNPMGVRLRTIFGSDMGHFDVLDFEGVLEEAYEQVDDGSMTKEDFKDFVFHNPIHMYTGMNPDFFVGTKIEAEVERAKKKLAKE